MSVLSKKEAAATRAKFFRSRHSAAGAPLAALAFAVGLWLTVSPWVLGYGVRALSHSGHANEVLCGVLIMLVALTGTMAADDARWTGPVLVVVGAWQALAPVFLDYRTGADPVPAVLNDLAAGVAVALLGAALTWIAAKRPQLVFD